LRFTRRSRCEYTVTDRKRAAAVRLQRHQHDKLPLLAPLIAETQPSIDAVMTLRVAHWITWEQNDRDRRASMWRQARSELDRHEPATRQALLEYWNCHRWLPGDPVYLLDLLHGFGRGRTIIDEGRLHPAVVTIPVGEAVAAFGSTKPLAGAWFGKRVHGPLRKPPHAGAHDSPMRPLTEGEKP